MPRNEKIQGRRRANGRLRESLVSSLQREFSGLPKPPFSQFFLLKFGIRVGGNSVNLVSSSAFLQPSYRTITMYVGLNGEERKSRSCALLAVTASTAADRDIALVAFRRASSPGCDAGATVSQCGRDVEQQRRKCPGCR